MRSHSRTQKGTTLIAIVVAQVLAADGARPQRTQDLPKAHSTDSTEGGIMTKPTTAWEVGLAFHEYSASNQEIEGAETATEAIDDAIAKTDEEETWKRGWGEGKPFACELHKRNDDGTLSRMPVPFLKSERAMLLSRDSDSDTFRIETIEGATSLKTPGRHSDDRPITLEVRDTDDGPVLSDAGETLADTDETQRHNHQGNAQRRQSVASWKRGRDHGE